MIIDCLQTCRGRLYTYAMGAIGGMGLALLASGAKRFALPHTEITTECLAQSPALGFNAAAMRSPDEEASVIQTYLRERLGRNAVQSLLENMTVNLEMALKIGLLHRVIDAKRPLQKPALKKGGRAL
jgi:ATP-dependent protease ClpP protease subunit